jgi:hypothetical protein
VHHQAVDPGDDASDLVVGDVFGFHQLLHAQPLFERLFQTGNLLFRKVVLRAVAFGVSVELLQLVGLLQLVPRLGF